MATIRCRLAARRLARAEQRFFDAYGRGGALAGNELVIPLGYFDDPLVRRELRRWRAGFGAPDLAALERAWRAHAPSGDERAFYRNLTHFLALTQGR